MHFRPNTYGTDDARRFELLVRGVTDYAIYMLDLDGYITSWNTGAERIKGYTDAEILGEHFSLFFTPEDQQRDFPKYILAQARRERPLRVGRLARAQGRQPLLGERRHRRDLRRK